jgi:DNA-binding MarR family transcriptional regulator
MRRAVGRLSRRLRQTRAGAELSPSQYEVLVTIVGRGPLRHADLAIMEGLNPTMLSRIIGKLETAGLVARLADSGDGRVVHVAATKMGRDLLTRIRNERSDALSLALNGLSEEEHQRLMAALPVLESLVERLGGCPQ